MNLSVSVVLPAYNEARRLPPFLLSLRAYLEAEFPNEYEIVIVDDGSDDHLARALESSGVRFEHLSLLRLDTNQGKGAALQHGILAARGRLFLLCDSDGSFAIEQETRLRVAIHGGADLAVGSRLLLGSRFVVQPPLLRRLLGRTFARLAKLLLPVPVSDPQCGFKMFRREPALRLRGTVGKPAIYSSWRCWFGHVVWDTGSWNCRSRCPMFRARKFGCSGTAATWCAGSGVCGGLCFEVADARLV